MCRRTDNLQLTANSGQGRSVTSIPMRAPLVRRRRKRHVPGQQLCGVGLERLTRSIRLPDGGGRHPTANVPGNSAAHRGTATAATTSASVTCSMGMRPRATDGRGVSQCQAKMARSDPRPPCGLPEVLVAVRTSRLPCRNAGKAPIFTPVPGASGESRLKRHPAPRRLVVAPGLSFSVPHSSNALPAVGAANGMR